MIKVNYTYISIITNKGIEQPKTSIIEQLNIQIQLQAFYRYHHHLQGYPLITILNQPSTCELSLKKVSC